jgi:hypothetical protein
MFGRGALPWALVLLCLVRAGAPTARAAGPADDDDGPAPKSGAAAPQRKDGYTIRLHRPMKAGQSYAWSADSTVINTLPVLPPASASPNAAAAAPVTTTDTVSVHLEGVVQILNVDKDGDVTEMACTVQECTARTGKERKTVVQPGRVILVEAGKWKPKLTATSGNFTIQDDVLLRSVLPLPRADDTTDDDVYGTTKQQAVGESWNLRPDQMLRSWAAAGYKLKAQNVSGSVKLKSAEIVDGVECLRVSGRAKIEHFLPPALDIPEGVDIGDATTELKFTKLLPADPSKPVLQDSHSLTVHFTLKRDPRALTPEAREGKLLRSVGVKLRLLSP